MKGSALSLCVKTQSYRLIYELKTDGRRVHELLSQHRELCWVHQSVGEVYADTAAQAPLLHAELWELPYSTYLTNFHKRVQIEKRRPANLAEVLFFVEQFPIQVFGREIVALDAPFHLKLGRIRRVWHAPSVYRGQYGVSVEAEPIEVFGQNNLFALVFVPLPL